MNKFFIVFCVFTNLSFAQKYHSFWTDADSLNKKRLIGSSVAIGTTYIGSIISLQQVWYKESFQKDFHLFNDGSNWLQMDKAGHVFTGYHLSSVLSGNFRWNGIESQKSNLIGSAIGFSYLTSLEVMDGFSKDWGFSWWDMASNFGGAALFVGQEYAFSKQIFIPKFSFHTTKYAPIRPEVLGSNFAEQLLKDYNGQTYWLSFSPGNLGLKSVPKWLCLSFGYSADEKLVGNAEVYQNYNSKREFLFSLDIDLNELNIKNDFWKKVLKQVNVIKIPLPAIYIRGSKFGVFPIYF
ncbi:MAG: DUF2279 domain-containing protein [Bacteroidetes bacterium]|nr:DUF2279 domain-containing protein [Bacteroidota bacterium]